MFGDWLRPRTGSAASQKSSTATVEPRRPDSPAESDSSSGSTIISPHRPKDASSSRSRLQSYRGPAQDGFRPAKFELELILAKASVLAGSYADALLALQRAGALCTPSAGVEYEARVHLWRALVQMKQGQLDDARQDVLDALYKYGQLPPTSETESATYYANKMRDLLDGSDHSRPAAPRALRLEERSKEALVAGVF